jgi:hypothetical protein
MLALTLNYFLVGVSTGLDIHLPIGLLFNGIGLLLVAFGAFSDKAIYQRSLGLNVSLGWGAVLLVSGAIMMMIFGKRPSAIRPDAGSFAGLPGDERS